MGVAPTSATMLCQRERRLDIAWHGWAVPGPARPPEITPDGGAGLRSSGTRHVEDAIVLAGGGATRLGGIDKPRAIVGGRSLLDRVIDAVQPACVVVVGPRCPTRHPVTWAREFPPGGGPAAAVAAGLPHVRGAHVAVLAADLPFLDGGILTRLAAAAAGRDGAMLVDTDGRDQVLVGVWRTSALRGAFAGPTHGARLGVLLRGLDAARVAADAGPRAPWFDCDTPDDLAAARALS